MPELQFLYLLRHAKAEPWYPGVNDFERPLNHRGAEHMQRLARWVQQSLPSPQRVLCSPSARTRETLEPFLSVWPDLPSVTRYVPEIYEATTGRLQALAAAAFEEVDSVMMVGHNPGFEYLALSVLNDRDADRVRKMATGSLAVIEFRKGWASGAGDGTLAHWIRRKDLGRAD
jgi:phosphohistidine phosphatase